MDKFVHFLTSYRATIILLLVYALGLATATFVENKMGTAAAKMLFYYSPLFLFLQLLLVINFFLLLIEKRFIQRKKWAFLAIHFALVVILLGALITFLFGKEGQVHIREGEKTNRLVMHTSKGIKTENLPFMLELTDFRLIRYPGSQSPSSFESDLRVYVDGGVREAKIFMNNVMDVKGYRFFQASYDDDELGTILSVNKDVAGRTVTYAGYLLLIFGFILMFFTPNSRFRKLQRRLKEVRISSFAPVLFLFFLSLNISSALANTLPFTPAGSASQTQAITTIDDSSQEQSSTSFSSPAGGTSLTQAITTIDDSSQEQSSTSSSSTSGGASQTQAITSPDEQVGKNRIPSEHAARFGKLAVQFRGRMMPMNTFSSEILRKIHKEKRFGDINSDQFLLGFFAMPQMWKAVPFITLSDKEIAAKYHLPDDYVSYNQLFDQNGNYKLLPQLQEIYHRPADKRSSFDKEMIKLDERVNILFRLLNHAMPGIYSNPNDPSHTWYAAGDDLSPFSPADSLTVTQSFGNYLEQVRLAITNDDWSKADEALLAIESYQLQNDKASFIHPGKLQAEFRYNRLDLFNRVKIGYFITGALLLIIALMHLLHERRWMRYLSATLFICIALLFTVHLCGMAVRWYIAGYAPWSNSYETMVYVSWVTLLAGFIFGCKSMLTRALATLFAGIILFVAALNWMDPQINTLVPVLKSPWLMFHVAVIVAAYGFFGISFLLGITNLLTMVFAKYKSRLSRHIKELTIINNLSLLAGLILMTTGTFLGAVWANESWGRYWGWDPKETWALITIVTYSIVTHLHLVKRWKSLWLFNLLSVFAFASVLMTFLGVNHFLSGMHSYGQTDGLATVFIYIAVAFGLLAILAIVSYRRRYRSNS